MPQAVIHASKFKKPLFSVEAITERELMKVIRNAYLPVMIAGISWYDSNAKLSTLAGQLTAGSMDGIGTTAKLDEPASFCEAPDGTVYAVESGSHTVKKFNPLTFEVITFAGSGSSGFENGVGKLASFNHPQSCTVDDYGNIYVGNFNQILTFSGISWCKKDNS